MSSDFVAKVQIDTYAALHPALRPLYTSRGLGKSIESKRVHTVSLLR